LSESTNKKLIPIIIVVAISIGAITLIFNIPSAENQPNTIEQTDFSLDEIGPIQENVDLQESESVVTSNLELKQTTTQLRAVIIDQLHKDIPNLKLQADAQRMLEDAGYQVDLYTTDDITVDFYKNLPSMNYHFILIRSHGGEDLSDENPTYLFTGEKYSKEKYTGEQIFHQIGYGIPIYEEELEELKEGGQDVFDLAYFTVGAKMVEEGMVGTFPDSIIIVAGCESARSHDLMGSFIKKGAKHVLGWAGTVYSQDNDKAIIWLLDGILVKKVSVLDAVTEINKELRPDFKNQATLKVFISV
jgi:hypothetical protein